MDAFTPLTKKEIASAKALGLKVATCCVCGLPTLYADAEKRHREPLTCGRMKCGLTLAEDWATK